MRAPCERIANAMRAPCHSHAMRSVCYLRAKSYELVATSHEVASGCTVGRRVARGEGRRKAPPRVSLSVPNSFPVFRHEQLPAHGNLPAQTVSPRVATSPRSARRDGSVVIGYVDGACWPNPGGLATYGWLIQHAEGRHVAHGSGRVHGPAPATNNIAEYAALIALLRHVRDRGLHLREVRMDSRLVVRQVSGRWRCRAPHLRALRDHARERLDGARLVWIPRDQNESADALAREAAEEWGREIDAPGPADLEMAS